MSLLSLWRRLAGDDLSQEGDHFGAVPFGGADEAAELASLGIDQQRSGQTEQAQAASGLAAGSRYLARCASPIL